MGACQLTPGLAPAMSRHGNLQQKATFAHHSASPVAIDDTQFRQAAADVAGENANDDTG